MNNMNKEQKCKEPKTSIEDGIFVAPSAVCKGKITIEPQSSIWYSAVIRADQAPIEIGRRSNIQDGAICHVDKDFPLHIGNDVTIGHGAIIHGCTIEDQTLVGMGAIIMNGARIGSDSIIGAGALIPEGKVIEPGSLVMGIPGKVIRKLSEQEIEYIKENANHYVQEALDYAKSET